MRVRNNTLFSDSAISVGDRQPFQVHAVSFRIRYVLEFGNFYFVCPVS